MPTFKISQLTTATAVSATNQFEINQNAASRSLEVSVLSTYIRSGDSDKAIVVSVSTASDALRITQTGAGNALAISNAGTENFRIGPAGQIGLQGANYGTSGQVLTSNGSAAAPSWQTASSTGALKNVQVFTSSGTYTRTAGVTTVVVIAVGGGGGGKGANGATAQPGGNGGAGGTTSFGSHVSAAGGSGATNSTGAAGGTGGTGATIAIKGAPSPENAGGGQGGGTPVSNAAGVAGVRGGGGSGASFTDGCFNVYVGGGGGQGETAIKYTTTVGATETITIGSGGTAGTSNASRAGGAGGAGYIIVYEYS
jgi:hypothetical protein